MKHLVAHEQLLLAAQELPDAVGTLLSRNGALTLKSRRQAPLFEYLCSTVVAQQLSAKAADSIWARVKSLPKQRGMTLAEFAASDAWEELRSCGLSRNKVRAVRELALKEREGALNPRRMRTLDTEALIEHLTELWGFGPWSAEMVAIFYFGHEDIWSGGDVSLQRGLERLSGGRKRVACRILGAVRPHRSYFALHVWRGLDSGVL
jgi:DNA-3-methyladenine glycosylase II